MSEYCLDFSIEENERVRIFNDIVQNKPDEVIEIIGSICGIYRFSGTYLPKKFLHYLCSNDSHISNELKYQCVQALLYYSEPLQPLVKNDKNKLLCLIQNNEDIKARNIILKNEAYNILDDVCGQIIYSDISYQVKVEAVKTLLEHGNYTKQVIKYMIYLIRQQNISNEVRYKTILSFEHNKGISDNDTVLKEADIVLKELVFDTMNNKENDVRYRILAVQYIFEKIKDDIDSLGCLDLLLSVAKDEAVEYNTRADASDMVLKYATDDYKNKASEASHILDTLGAKDGVVNTIYDNMQNVHKIDVNESVVEILMVLNKYEHEPFHIIYQYILDIIPSNNVALDKIKNALCRIEIDRGLYSKLELTLQSILCKLWSYIQEQEYKEEMTKRLIEELIEMSGTCSTGYVSRLCNVLSGFGELSVKISFCDQIIANFVSKFNHYASNICAENSIFLTDKDRLYDIFELSYYLNKTPKTTDNDKTPKILFDEFLYNDNFSRHKTSLIEEFQENVLNEMTINSIEHNKRRNLGLFTRVYLPFIREELWLDFKDNVRYDEFDLFMRKASCIYSGNTDIIF